MSRLRPLPAFGLTCALLLGCTQFPELDGVVDEDVASAAYLKLRPTEVILADVPAPEIDAAMAEGLSADAQRLRAKANRLRGPVVDPATKRRMARGIAPIPDP